MENDLGRRRLPAGTAGQGAAAHTEATDVMGAPLKNDEWPSERRNSASRLVFPDAKL
jgi:hypothetical protein